MCRMSGADKAKTTSKPAKECWKRRKNKALTQKLTSHYEAGFRLYSEALDEGVSKEMARLFLPGFSVYYTWVAKIDAHT